MGHAPNRALRWLVATMVLATGFAFAQFLGRDPIVERLLIDSGSVRYDCATMPEAFGQVGPEISESLEILAGLEADMRKDSGLDLDFTCAAFDGNFDRFKLQLQVFLNLSQRDVVTQMIGWEALGPGGFMTILVDEGQEHVYLVFLADFSETADTSVLFVGAGEVP